MMCFDCGQIIIGKVYTRAIISLKGRVVHSICTNCFNTYKSYYPSGYKFTFKRFNVENNEMPKATLSYEALQLDSEGIPTEGAYKLKLEGNFKTHIEPIVKFIKTAIPSSDRTYDPTTYEWAFHEKYYPLMEQAFKGSHFQVSFTVRKEDFVELKRKQAEFAKQAGQTFQTRQYDTNADLITFAELLEEANLIKCINDVKDWSRETATSFWKKALRAFHPDLHPEKANHASTLNEVWSRLKEGYYIK